MPGGTSSGEGNFIGRKLLAVVVLEVVQLKALDLGKMKTIK